MISALWLYHNITSIYWKPGDTGVRPFMKIISGSRLDPKQIFLCTFSFPYLWQSHKFGNVRYTRSYFSSLPTDIKLQIPIGDHHNPHSHPIISRKIEILSYGCSYLKCTRYIFTFTFARRALAQTIPKLLYRHY